MQDELYFIAAGHHLAFGYLALMPLYLPVVPVTDVHSLPSSAQHLSNVGDTIGWPRLRHYG
jgi:hypothetical protein